MTKGILRFSIPDESVPAEERSFFATPQNKEFVPKEVELHDFRTSTDVTKGPAGLDVQGFTWLKHHSKIVGSDDFFDGNNIEDIYFQEVSDMMKEVTGAKKVLVWSGVTRRKLPVHQDSKPKVQHRKGGEMDQIFDKMRRDIPFMTGKDPESSIEPVRNVHIDLSNKGLRDTVRYIRRDITEAGKEALEAEDVGSNEVPRYAAYSVWRPLSTVKRDPLAACDWRTVDKINGLYDAEYRNPAENEKGEFMNTIRIILPPKEPIEQKWYYYSDQSPEDVLILKIGDTASDKNPEIASGSPHGSPMLLGTEGLKEPRQSIEVRVIAFW